MILNWLRRIRRRRVLAAPFPRSWLAVLQQDVAHHQLLAAAEQARLRDDLRLFIAEKRWEGCGGLVLSDRMKVVIAAQACYLVLGLDLALFGHVRTILVYPGAFADPRGEHGLDGLVTHEVRVGEAWERGPVILSWPEVLAGGRRSGDGHNVVFHEFAHQLDMLDFLLDGTPPLDRRADYARWREVMTREYRRLQAASRHRRAALLDDYGAVSEAEFFAVATECFFERPRAMRQRHRELYDLLCRGYRQDPAAREDGAAANRSESGAYQ